MPRLAGHWPGIERLPAGWVPWRMLNALTLIVALAAPPAAPCPAGTLQLGVNADGSARCGSWTRLQAESRKGAPIVRLPKGALSRAGRTYRISRAAVQAVLSQGLQRLAGQARVEPEYAQGKRIGFRVARIRAGSIFESLGLRNGDLLLDVNGADLGNPAQVLGLYGLLMTPNAKASIRLRRGKAPVTLTWQIDG